MLRNQENMHSTTTLKKPLTMGKKKEKPTQKKLHNKTKTNVVLKTEDERFSSNQSLELANAFEEK